MVELLTCSFPRKYHSDLNNLCNYIFITYLLTVLLFSTCSDLPLCWGKFQEVASCCSEKSCIYLNFGNSDLSEGVFVALFSPRQTTEGGVTSGQYRSTTLAVLGPPFILCGTKSTHFLSVLQHSVKL